MDITEKLPGHLSPRTSALFSMLPACLFSSRRSEKNKYLSLGFHLRRRLRSRCCASLEHQLLDLKFPMVSVRVRRGAFLLSPPAARAPPAAGEGAGKCPLNGGTSHQHGGHIAHVGSRFVTQTPIEGRLVFVPFPAAPTSAHVKRNPFFPNILNYLSTKRSLPSAMLCLSSIDSLKHTLKYFKPSQTPSIHIEMLTFNQ